MIQNYSRWRVLRVFFDDPNPKEGFTIRGIAREIGLAESAVKLHLDVLGAGTEDGYPLIVRSQGRIYPTYWANRASMLFRFYKRMDILFRLEERPRGRPSLLDLLFERCQPDAIVLFGSAARGEDLRESDVDLYVPGKAFRGDVSPYARLLRREISLHQHPFLKLSPELRNNILNGVIVRGHLKVFHG